MELLGPLTLSHSRSPTAEELEGGAQGHTQRHRSCPQ